MAQAYLFVHFREKTTPDGEQVYFGISRDGFHWEAVNDGAPGAGQGYVPFVAATPWLPENLFVLMLPLVPLRLQAWNDSSDYRGGLRADQNHDWSDHGYAVKSLSA